LPLYGCPMYVPSGTIPHVNVTGTPGVLLLIPSEPSVAVVVQRVTKLKASASVAQNSNINVMERTIAVQEK
jgi:hypothetical protein